MRRFAGKAPVSPRVVVVAGAGDVGGRLALRRALAGDDVVALRRRDAANAPGIRAVRADLASGEGLRRLPRRVDALVFCAAPDRRDEETYRALFVDGLRRLLDACEAPRVLFVSSTAVYGEDAGEWVDESTPARPAAFNGHVLRDAENVLATRSGSSVLRCSGLYGPGRLAMLRRARAGDPGTRRWSNRLHVDDAATALSHLLDLEAPASLYLGSDDEPVRERDLLAWLRAGEGLAATDPMRDDDSAEGRRIRNRRLRDSGWSPAHADFRSGYRPLLAAREG